MKTSKKTRKTSIFASDEHLLYNCEIKRSFWVALRSWLMECNINLEPLPVVNVLADPSQKSTSQH